MTLADHEFDDVARRFALLSDPTRLRVLSYLLEAGEASPTEVARAIGLGRTNVSQHLSRLLSAGMVGRRREGQAFQYRVIDAMLRPLCELVCSSLRERTESSVTHLEIVAP
jgi:DNA-binding transcriptional ArsR family regulator